MSSSPNIMFGDTVRLKAVPEISGKVLRVFDYDGRPVVLFEASSPKLRQIKRYASEVELVPVISRRKLTFLLEVDMLQDTAQEEKIQCFIRDQLLPQWNCANTYGGNWKMKSWTAHQPYEEPL